MSLKAVGFALWNSNDTRSAELKTSKSISYVVNQKIKNYVIKRRLVSTIKQIEYTFFFLVFQDLKEIRETYVRFDGLVDKLRKTKVTKV